MQTQLDNIEKKLDKLAETMENHSAELQQHFGRLAAAETSINWLKAHVKTVTGVGITAMVILAGTLIKSMIP